MTGKRDRISKRHEHPMCVSLVRVLICSAAFLILVAGCAREADVVPTATIAPTATIVPTPTSPVATLTPSPLPTVVAISPLEQALVALRQVSSFRTKGLCLRTAPGISSTVVLTRESISEYLLGPPEQGHTVFRDSEGIEEELICIGTRCWSRTGQHPWVRLYGTGATFLQDSQSDLDATTIVETDILTTSGDIVVDWRRPVSVSPSIEHTIAGRTWLQADTRLPLRQVTDFREMDGPLVWATFYDYDEPIVIEAPIGVFVTPVPTVPAIERTPTAVHQEESPFPGDLIVPEGPGPFPAVVVLHGSEGGTRWTPGIARRFAQAGYVALALCYFGCPGTPQTLQNVNLEVVIDAADYLKNREDVQPDAVALVGFSRGAELALIVGALDPDVHAVVSFSGSPWVIGGYPEGGTAWLYQDKPLPFLVISVEQINGPVLLIHGERDTLWPVGFSYRIADRLEAHDHAYELAVYPDFGHNFYSGSRDPFRRAVAFLERAFQ